MVCVKTSLVFLKIDVALPGSSNLEVVGIAMLGLTFTSPPPTP